MAVAGGRRPGRVAPEPAAGPVAPRRYDRAVLGAVAAGGIVGAEARYAVSVWLPHRPGEWPTGTWLVNTSGCLLIGVLMVVLTELTVPHRLARPFLGVGVLGGYTTFSTAAVEVHQLGDTGRSVLALAYLLGTVAAALAATAAGAAATRALGTAWVRVRTRRREEP